MTFGFSLLISPLTASFLEISSFAPAARRRASFMRTHLLASLSAQIALASSKCSQSVSGRRQVFPPIQKSAFKWQLSKGRANAIFPYCINKQRETHKFSSRTLFSPRHPPTSFLAIHEMHRSLRPFFTLFTALAKACFVFVLLLTALHIFYVYSLSRVCLPLTGASCLKQQPLSTIFYIHFYLSTSWLPCDHSSRGEVPFQRKYLTCPSPEVGRRFERLMRRKYALRFRLSTSESHFPAIMKKVN